MNEKTKFRAAENHGQLKIQLLRNFRFAARAVPDAGDGDNFLFRQNFVDDAVRSQDEFTNGGIIAFRSATSVWPLICVWPKRRSISCL